MKETILLMDNIVKSFSGVFANRGITLDVKQGEIHALLGENGAGKTVLMSILDGLYKPDDGKIFFRGKDIKINSPKDAIKNRIGMVHQHFMLIPTLNVRENLILGQYSTFKVLNNMDQIDKDIRKISSEFSLDVDPTALVSSLSVGEQQRVEILKALYHGVDLLILDEPTAVLTPQETHYLLKFLRQLSDKGTTIIFITHKLNEVMAVSDRVTIIRDGSVVGNLNVKDTNPKELARLMVGRDVLMDLNKERVERGELIISVKDLSATNERGLLALKRISFDVHAGEIVGIAGVSGNGQTEIALALTGLIEDIEFKEIVISGKKMTKKSLKGSKNLNFAHIPEDRQKMGIILPFSISENFILERYNKKPFSKFGFLSNRKINSYSNEMVKKYRIKAANVNGEIANLSGGNQQKVVVARELDRKPCFLLANQPTRGIDIGATEFVHQQILEQRNSNVAILLISTELEEIFTLSDRILVIYDGQIMGEMPPDPSMIEEIGLMMAGKKKDELYEKEAR